MFHNLVVAECPATDWAARQRALVVCCHCPVVVVTDRHRRVDSDTWTARRRVDLALARVVFRQALRLVNQQRRRAELLRTNVADQPRLDTTKVLRPPAPSNESY